MNSCVNDLTPIILAVAAVISIQVPLLITALIAGIKVKTGPAGPPGPPGEVKTGPAGPPGEDKT